MTQKYKLGKAVFEYSEIAGDYVWIPEDRLEDKLNEVINYINKFELEDIQSGVKNGRATRTDE